MKKYRWTIFITTLVALSPMLAGIILWKQLPDTIATSFGTNGAANGWSSKAFAVFGLPLLLAGVHLLCSFAVLNDPKRNNINGRMMKWIFWIVPAVSLICCIPDYGIALGMKIDITLIVHILLGLIFIIMGNYMHKVKQNYTVGIKLPWTLDSEENWNRTHRLASWLWVLGGIAWIVNGVVRLSLGIVTLVILFAVAVIPMIYSWLLYRKGVN